MKRYTTALGIVSGVLTLLLGFMTAQKVSHLTLQELSNSVVVEAELDLFVNFLLLVTGVLLLSECLRRIRLERRCDKSCHLTTTPFRRVFAWMSGILVANTSGIVSSDAPAPAAHGVSVDAALSPIAASAVLSHILRRRREQLRDHVIPDQFRDEEIDALKRIRDVSDHNESLSGENTMFEFTPDVRTVLSAVERVRPTLIEETCCASKQDWLIELKLFGYPMAVSANGTIAEFRKKRSLELLTWLTLNRDRARRSTARTAMWDLDVSDATFSTVVSDLRRALRDAVGEQGDFTLLPTTYSDDLPLSLLVTTDVERLHVEHLKFQETGLFTDELRGLLKGMRDIPLAGTSYSWADLDGTTTRLVMSALAITTDVATVLIGKNELNSASVAAMAGLRIFPGCEELLDLQKKCLYRVQH
jgi:hypothetical protein